jgi:hypothetical protein
VAHQIISVRAEDLSESLPHRWTIGPAAVGTMLIAAVTTLRRRALEPGMPRMSSEWLLSHDKFGGDRFKSY